MLPSDGADANPRASTHVDVEPATPGTLASHVEARARALASAPYVHPDTALAPEMAELDYDGYRSIRFRPEAALWAGELPFEIQLLHRGFLFRSPVRVHMVDAEGVAEVPFDAELFSYDGPAGRLGRTVEPGLGFSGFRVHYPLNLPGVADEVVVFQGASYFRLVGPGQVHGLSSRGLAVGLGSPEGEEFPTFTDFWLVRPDPGDDVLELHALLDGPSVTGAYRFELEPGDHTELRVDARLFAREDVRKLGVAPLSSMFLYGPNRSSEFDDFRPEVHDSDGLMMLTRVGEWLWRPLSNRRIVRGSALRDGEPQGFGLAQRARDFGRYLDLEALYHRRPSAWVALEEGDWGVGGVELLEIPTDSEFSDNIAVAWVPDAPFAAGEERRFRYRLITFDERVEAQTLAQVRRTGIGRDALPGAAVAIKGARRFIVDFTDGPLDGLARDAGPEAVLATSSGSISDVRVDPLPPGLGWRVSFRLEPDGDRPADMRLHLALGGARLSETWTYVWYPDELG